jgi:hypothetical protein
MWQSLTALLASRKTILFLAALGVSAGFVFAGKLSIEDFTKFLGALTGTLMLAIAGEDGAAKRNPGNIKNDGELQ